MLGNFSSLPQKFNERGNNDANITYVLYSKTE